jgi:hypothetical protein
MKLNIAMIGGGDVLTGATNGRRVLSELLAAAEPEPLDPEVVFLDFSGVTVATASFLRESILAFRDFVRSHRSNLYPVIADANAAVRDELQELVRPPRGDVLIACTLGGGEPKNAMLIGNLEKMQRRTFDLVRAFGETGASELMRHRGVEDRVRSATAWNNRLASLASLGLLVEMRQGRTKRYKPVLEGV